MVKNYKICLSMSIGKRKGEEMGRWGKRRQGDEKMEKFK
jgi:hypothetical protein